jgi:hypothetical protein
MSEDGSKYEGKILLALYNELKSTWERENYIEVCPFEERRGIGWQKMDIWRLKGMRTLIKG